MMTSKIKSMNHYEPLSGSTVYARTHARNVDIRQKVHNGSYVTEARKKWPTAAWIIGSGPYASVSLCRPYPSVMLFATLAEAEIAKGEIDATGCSGGCMGRHLIARLDKQTRRQPILQELS